MIITISASYGAGGSELGPKIARRLGVPFFDRAVPVDVADQLGISVEEAGAVEEDRSNRLWDSFAALSLLAGFTAPAVGDTTVQRELFEAMRAQLNKVADDGDGVILGHGAAVALAGRPGALHVRLDGDPDGRVRAAMRQHGIDADEAQAKRKQNDQVRSGYVRHFYHADSASPALYDLVLDTVRLGWDLTEELIVTAVEHRDAQHPQAQHAQAQHAQAQHQA